MHVLEYMKKDPVCEMQVDEDEAEQLDHEGTSYYFCCGGCKSIFEKDPSKYV